MTFGCVCMAMGDVQGFDVNNMCACKQFQAVPLFECVVPASINRRGMECGIACHEWAYVPTNLAEPIMYRIYDLRCVFIAVM